jgi:hypothetical protein
LTHTFLLQPTVCLKIYQKEELIKENGISLNSIVLSITIRRNRDISNQGSKKDMNVMTEMVLRKQQWWCNEIFVDIGSRDTLIGCH